VEYIGGQRDLLEVMEHENGSPLCRQKTPQIAANAQSIRCSLREKKAELRKFPARNGRDGCDREEN
jgi:hypothetical protein